MAHAMDMETEPRGTMGTDLIPNPDAMTTDQREAWVQEQSRIHREAYRMGAKIGRAVETGRVKYIRHTVRDYLYHPDVRMSAALRAYSGGFPRRRDVLDLGDRVHAWAGGYTPIWWWPQPKRSGNGYRKVCSLPPRLKAVHIMIGKAIWWQTQTSGNVYGTKGNGRDEAAIRLKELQNAGYVHLAKTDIVNCFDSFDPDTLFQLPLPKEVTRRALITDNLTFEMRRPKYGQRRKDTSPGHPLDSNGHIADATGDLTADDTVQCIGDYSGDYIGSGIGSISIDAREASGPTGLMQGSPASNQIMAWFFQDLPQSDDAMALMCFDNIVVAARTAAGSRRLMDRTVSYFETSRAGPLATCEPEYADGKPMEFLGYLFDPDKRDVEIAPEPFERLYSRLVTAEMKDEQERVRRFEAHAKNVAENAMYRCADPLTDFYPIYVWQALRRFRAGFAAVPSDSPSFVERLTETDYLANHTRLAEDLHNHLFADRDTEEGEMIRAILYRPTHQRRKN